ncbi:PREDICTED: uncharacterized protein LOC108380863 isoform X2 [Rhagoletis zephyria]|uniref:uncharacterized protein LOC108380863 isoform X2 n=1 Tax=Rhagoletis zephyria TaxID=28612 RepID=UPI00081188AA|nr:PREDICTED: uncharacterized protein LOC108380863 isoform X2 [Rhagoletis zephyria]XP_036347696.1 uncharacterized protein LOC118757071 isoform X2 [Rhagoletis pomonella]
MSEKLKEILHSFALDELLEELTAAGIEFRHLPYLSEGDIADAVRKVGIRAEFREKLFDWRNKQTYDADGLHSNVDQCEFHYSLKRILKDCSAGRTIHDYYECNGHLNNSQRDRIINAVVEHVVANNIKLRPVNFEQFLKDIQMLFPEEKCSLEYYYIPRKGKRPPAGKLFSKYINITAKERKKKGTTKHRCDNLDTSIPDLATEFDESIEASIKEELRRESSDWEVVLDRWDRSYNIRQRDLTLLSNYDFIKEWPKLKDARGPQLINSDFKRLHPNKEHLLKTKWSAFKQNIREYYYLNIANAACKSLLKDLSGVKQIDAEDCVLTTLIHSILPPTARFHNTSGASKAKATILDAQEFFIIKVETIGNVYEEIQKYVDKCYMNSFTVQPFIIMEGTYLSPKAFFAYIDKIIYKFDSFIECLDCTFKIFQVLNLKYPAIAANAWTFIQRYFFEIETTSDIKTPALVSLVNYLKNK